MNRRDFLGAAALSIFAPRFGRWFRQGVGLWRPDHDSIWETVRPGLLTDPTVWACKNAGPRFMTAQEWQAVLAGPASKIVRHSMTIDSLVTIGGTAELERSGGSYRAETPIHIGSKPSVWRWQERAPKSSYGQLVMK